MKTQLTASLIAVVTLISANSTHATTFQRVEITDPGEANLTVGIWYPSDEPAPDEPNTEFGMALAADGQIVGENGGLIVISHGFSGWYAGHANTAIALADAGYIVAAPTHAGNTWSDMSSPVAKWVIDRPRHMSRVIDHMLEESHLSANINPEKIGAYGFSAGGYTAIGLVGGVPDFDHAQTHCRDNPSEYVCAEGLIDEMLKAELDTLPESAWGADDRISAASIAAPGWGFSYTKNGLRDVTADIQVWSGQLDDSVPTETNAALIAANLPTAPETHWVEDANHFAFLVMPCREEFKQQDPKEYQMVCGDKAGFDRHKFHHNMNSEMVRFFNQTLLAR